MDLCNRMWLDLFANTYIGWLRWFRLMRFV